MRWIGRVMTAAPPVSTEATEELLPLRLSMCAVAPTSSSSASSVLSIFSRIAATANVAAAPARTESVTPSTLSPGVCA